MPESGRTYKIKNNASNTYLDLSGDDDTTILGWEGTDGDNQRWTFEKQDDDLWVIRSARFGDKFLALAGGHSDNTRLIATDEPVRWQLERDEEHRAWRILVPHTPFSVDLTGHGNADNGTPVAIWGRWGAANQTWHFDEAD